MRARLNAHGGTDDRTTAPTAGNTCYDVRADPVPEPTSSSHAHAHAHAGTHDVDIGAGESHARVHSPAHTHTHSLEPVTAHTLLTDETLVR